MLKQYMWLPDSTGLAILTLLLVPGVLGALSWISMLLFLGAPLVLPASIFGWAGSWIFGLFLHAYVTCPEEID